MILPKRIFPETFNKKEFSSTPFAESLPFHIKECGYIRERKLIFGKENNFNDYLLVYTLDGVASYTKNQYTQLIQPHSIVVTACNTTSTFSRNSKDWTAYYFIVSGSHARLFYNLVRTQNNIILNNPFTNILDLFMELYENCISEHDTNDFTYQSINSSLLIHHIFTALYEQTSEINTIKGLTPVQQNVVSTALKFIQENYSTTLDIDTICSEISFSKHYFCKLFKKQMGITVHQYVNEYRISKSKELLSYSKLSINSIATQVGFRNTLTFLRAFEKSMHMTPSEYRNYY